VLVAPEVSLTTNDAIADCSDFTLEFPADSAYFAGESPAYSNVTATVSSGGGTVEDAFDLIDAGHVPPLDAPAFSEGTGVCGSCCLNEEPTPAEITINLEYLIESSFGRPEEGDYVLSRSSGLIDAFNANPTRWATNGTYVFEGSTYSFSLEAVIEPCATLANTGPGLLNTFVDAGCGDTCYKKCRLRINLSGPFFEFVPGFYYPGCDCIDFPVCSPPAGAYTLVTGMFNTPAYTATIS
jgi:hypothetical protein